MTYRYLTDLADVARKSGLKVVELPGWKKNGRPASTGGFDPMGVLCHHTGGFDEIGDAADDLRYARWMAFTGRSDLPAPLCHLALSAEGVVYVCAAGRANHGGESGGSGPIPKGDGNALLVGIEAMNNGSQGWGSKGFDASGHPITQGVAYERLCAALCAHYDWPASHVRAHRETSVTGKWDPGLLDMEDFRADIAAALNKGQDWFDMATQEELRAVVREEVRSEMARQFDLNADLSPNNPSETDTVRNVLRGMIVLLRQNGIEV